VVSQSIICAIDGSDRGADALRVAVPLSSRLTTRLVLVHVAQVPRAPGASGVPGAYKELREAALLEGNELLERVADDYGAPPGTELVVEVGDPVERIVAVAKHEAAALVVVASRGRGATKSALLGSVSTSLGATAPCPVIVVPPEASANRGGGSSRLAPTRARISTVGEER
jgi:nucleotide-binding universal stress UspA family protein